MKKIFTASFGFSLLAVGLLLVLGRSVSAAASAKLYLSPACGPTYSGNNLTVDIHENSGSTAVNAVQTDLSYSSSQFNVISVTVASGWTQAQNDTSTPGSVLFAAFRAGGSGNDVTGDQVVATAVFQAKVASGVATVSFANTSAVTADDGMGTNILTSTTGGAYPQTLAHTCGSLVKAASSPSVYLISDGTRKYIPTPSIYVSQGFNWNWISTLTAADQALPSGVAVPFRDGSVIKGSGASVYVIDNSNGFTQKRPITSGAVYSALGYTASDIISVSDSQLSSVPDGTPISSAATHPNGSLISSSNGTIYLISSGTKRYIGSVYILYTYGYNTYQIKGATSGDLALPSGDNMYLREGLLIKGSGPNLYLTEGYSGIVRKRLITSMTIFAALGYNTGQIITVPDGNLPPTNGPNL